ncbi:MAG: class I SAM-dependent methyltransferase [Thermodesulfobacteriota bacterium]
MNGPENGGGLLLRDAAAFYDRVAPFYDREYAFGPDVTRRQAAWLAAHCPPGPLLDLGCGSGRMLAPLARAGFAPVLGLDCSPAMLALARAACPAAPLIRADAAHGLPFAAASFSAIVSLHSSLIHICDPAAMAGLVADCRRALRPGGWLVIEAPHPRSYPPDVPPGRWRRFAPGILCRRVGSGLEELCIEDLGGLRTRVRLWEIEDLRRWFVGWSRVELHAGFCGGRFDPERGTLMVVAASL